MFLKVLITPYADELSAEHEKVLKRATCSFWRLPDRPSHLSSRSPGFRMMHTHSTSTQLITLSPVICSFLLQNSVPQKGHVEPKWICGLLPGFTQGPLLSV